MRLDGLELRIPPPVVTVAVAAAMFGIARALPALHVELPGRPALLAAAGVGIGRGVGVSPCPHHRAPASPGRRLLPARAALALTWRR